MVMVWLDWRHFRASRASSDAVGLRRVHPICHRGEHFCAFFSSSSVHDPPPACCRLHLPAIAVNQAESELQVQEEERKLLLSKKDEVAKKLDAELQAYDSLKRELAQVVCPACSRSQWSPPNGWLLGVNSLISFGVGVYVSWMLQRLAGATVPLHLSSILF